MLLDRRAFCGALLLAPAAAQAEIGSTKLEPKTAQAFDRYVAKREALINSRAEGNGFLWCDERSACKAGLKGSQVHVEPGSASGAIEIPDGLIHDWIGVTHIPGVTVDQVTQVLRDYNNHRKIFPEVIDGRALETNGETSRVFLRLRKTKVITVVLNTYYDARFHKVNDKQAWSKSVSTKITQVSKAGTAKEHELPPGEDQGFLWRLNSYWRFLDRDGGVYVECETISLSRGVPMLLSTIVSPIVKQLPRESLEKTLMATRSTLLKR